MFPENEATINVVSARQSRLDRIREVLLLTTGMSCSSSSSISIMLFDE